MNEPYAKRWGTPCGRPASCPIWRATTKVALTSLLVAALLAIRAPAALAGSFTDIGVVYSLSSHLVGSTPTTQTFNVTLVVNDTSYSGPSPGSDLLDAVAVKVDDNSNILGEFMLSGPSNWKFVDGGTNGSGVGCGKMSPNGFDCSQGGSASYDLGTGSNGGTFTWVFQVTVNSGTLYTSGASVKAQYVDSATMKQVAMTSQAATNDIVAPEPASMALLGTALLGAYGLLRRKL